MCVLRGCLSVCQNDDLSSRDVCRWDGRVLEESTQYFLLAFAAHEEEDGPRGAEDRQCQGQAGMIGVLDTDCDPSVVDIVIPGNDDALKSVRLLVDHMATAVEEGCANRREQAIDVVSPMERERGIPGDEPRPTRHRPLPRLRRKDGAGTEPAATEDAMEDSQKVEVRTEAPDGDLE